MRQKIRFQIEGMTCQACASRIEKVLNKKDFISEASVNFASEEAQVSFDDSQTSLAEIIQIIEKTGFSAQEKTGEQLSNIAKEAHMGWRLWLLLAINIPFLIGMLGMMIGSHALMLPPLWQFALASVVQLWLAIPFYRSAIASIRGKLANMDVLVTIGTLSIYLYSTYMLFYHRNMGHDAHDHLYFEAAVMVIGFVSLGKFLEQRTKKSSLNSISLLLKLTPQNVNVLRDDVWQILPLNQVQIGDYIRANHGERIAADGMVESGHGWADESHLTGESKPEAKNVGSRVLAGAMMTDGSIVYRATQLGSHTLLGDMMNALSEAQGTKAPIARIADKAAAIFVPTVVSIALLTLLINYFISQDFSISLLRAVAVLVIACPCALGLATPAAIMVGIGKAAKHGIWFKDAEAMEQAARVDTIILDKTGTLTQGRPQIIDIYHIANTDENEMLALAATVEQNARHPLASAIVQTALSRDLPLPQAHQIQNDIGSGICAQIEGVGEVKVGKPDYCQFVLPAKMPDIWQSASMVAVSVNGKAIGAFALADTLKPDSQQAICRLKAQGIDVQIMSGDNPATVAHIAQQLGITQAQGNMSPRDKANAVQEIKKQGKIVAMVGDGINDAPALAAANVSFAMKNGADIAEHTASATLMQHSVNQLVDALVISRATLKNIKQNLFFAFFYNILGIPLAALGMLTPVIAGAAMAASSISVLSNALRLKRIKVD